MTGREVGLARGHIGQSTHPPLEAIKTGPGLSKIDTAIWTFLSLGNMQLGIFKDSDMGRYARILIFVFAYREEL